MATTSPHTRRPRLTQPALLGAAATSALLALPHHSDAAVVYNNITDIVLSGSAIADLDINGGGNDFRFGAGFTTASFVNGLAIASALAPQRALRNGSGFVRRLASGAVISAGAPAGFGLGHAALRAFGVGPSNAGTWVLGQTNFMGIRLDAGSGNYSYGWVRMKVEDADPGPVNLARLTIFDYAYETTVNTPITTPVPEPSSALLALAGLGAMALPRRRKAA